MARFTIDMNDDGDFYASCTLDVKDGTRFLVRRGNTFSVSVTLIGVSELALLDNVVLELWTHSGSRLLAATAPHSTESAVESYIATFTASADAVASDDYAAAPRIVVKSAQTDDGYDYITALTLYKTRQTPIIEFEAERCTATGELDAAAQYVRVVGYKIVSGDGVPLSAGDLYGESVTVNGEMIPFYVGMTESALTESGYFETVPEWITTAFAASLALGIEIELYWMLDGAEYVSRWSGNVVPSRVNFHLSGASTGGVAFGKFSSSTEGHPKFECAYPAFFDGRALFADLTQLKHTSVSTSRDGTVIFESEPVVDPGLYLVIGNMQWPSTGSSGYRTSILYHVEGNVNHYLANVRQQATGNTIRMNLCGICYANAGDRFQMLAVHSYSSAITLTNNNNYNFMKVVRLL